MPFEPIENVSSATATPPTPADGIRFTARSMARRNGGLPVRYIQLQIGAGLARQLAIVGERTALALAFGSGSDAGRMRLGVDFSGSTFPAKRTRTGNYTLTINAASADGLFALAFHPVTVAGPKVTAVAGKAPWVVFDLPPSVLALDD